MGYVPYFGLAELFYCNLLFISFRNMFLKCFVFPLLFQAYLLQIIPILHAAYYEDQFYQHWSCLREDVVRFSFSSSLGQ